jgi:hypothetical protein
VESLPVIGGAAGIVAVLVALIGLARFLLGDNREVTQLRADLGSLNEKVSKLEVLYDEQRTEKHALRNELTKLQMLLGIIVDLADRCTCGALALVDDLMKKSADGTFTDAHHPNRRVDDP